MRSYLPKTKRFLYYTLFDWISNFEYNSCFQDTCYTFYGVRKIGKTTIMKQLNQDVENSAYFDCSNYISSGDLVEDIELSINNGKSVFFVDEICKYSDLEYLKGFIKVCCNCLFIITGSTSNLVRNIGESIGRGPVYYLPPITYCEWLSWSNGVNYLDTLKISNQSTFINFIKTGTSPMIRNPKNYIESVVSDTSKSYIIRNIVSADIEIDIDFFYEILEYMALVNISIIENSGKFSKILSYKADNSDISVNNDIKNKIKNISNSIFNHKTKEVKFYIELLNDSGLLNTALSKNDYEDIINTSQNKYYIFRYPQYLYSVLNISNLGRIYYSNIIENLLLDRASSYYKYAGKYRDNRQREIDIVYRIFEYHYGVEVKDRCLKHIKPDKYKILAEDLNIKSVSYTANDIETPFIKLSYKDSEDFYYVVRTDILMLLWEIDYFNDPVNPLTVEELIKKYFK